MSNVNSTYKTYNEIEMAGEVESAQQNAVHCIARFQEAMEEDGERVEKGEKREKHSLEFD